MSLVDVAGWIGALLVVGAYAAITIGTSWHPAALHLANLIGSAGLAAVAFAHHTWPSVFVNGIWLAIASVALAHRRPDHCQGRRPRRTRTRPPAVPKPRRGNPNDRERAQPCLPFVAKPAAQPL
jgi:hypothetical protein